jgi:hypothetical protein
MKTAYLTFFIVVIAAFSLYAGGGVEASSNIRVPEVPGEITSATITAVTPPQVLPETLVLVEGSGFGTVPAPISIGGTTITEFVSWSDGEIWLKIPETGISGSAPLILGNASSPQEIKSAGNGAITVKFVVNVGAFSKDITKILAENSVEISSTGNFQPPLYLKGEFVKAGPDFGERHPTWDGGTKIKMYQTPGGDQWFVELVLTRENLASFRGLSMEFGIEDGGGQRSASQFESNFAAALNRTWAAKDEFPASVEYPTIYPSSAAPGFDAESAKLTVSFP